MKSSIVKIAVIGSNSFSGAGFVDFAAQSMVAESWKFPEQWFTTNAVSMNCFFINLFLIFGLNLYE